MNGSILVGVPKGTRAAAGPLGSAAAPRLVRARTLLDCADLAQVERKNAEGGRTGGPGGPECMVVFSNGDGKHAAALDGLVPANAVAERLADGTVYTVPTVVGG